MTTEPVQETAAEEAPPTLGIRKIKRPGLPDRYVIQGFKDLCTDEIGKQAFLDLFNRFIGKLPDTTENRKSLRLESQKLHKELLAKGHLFRQDGRRLY